MALFEGFPAATLQFLSELNLNNNKTWFNDNKSRYEALVREPALAFIESIGPGLTEISPHFRAIPKKVGGSLMRVYRDTRFAKDKTPYKTNIGIQFRHELGKDVHAPGFYVHIEPEGCFVGAGIWHPESKELNQIRTFIDDNPAAWKKAVQGGAFAKQFQLEGDSLIRPPRGFSADHPLIDDLKRKDFIAIKSIASDSIHGKRFTQSVLKDFQQADLLMRYLCTALNVNY
ncbi:DUF2461 domain-containing protein [Sedimenticola selenatireducens]|uniref:DUF2461 domain-containing protein n=1 Tax=Sedimenticola selenatireducens TaxID=191960 RepID=A0A557SM10_9GAMM|nr:DUF2461 domain-containing protein [Sedimenticola selenatireducens]TVO78465.1 DUF2461 domain-containing protein [Sedimenticola selenatireducens]TVT62676.1 MAG: DUF2461 domain-containing protein [Sedimenticola selenatireducens]